MAVEVDVFATQDVNEIHYSITNLGATRDLYTVSYIDDKTNRESKQHTLVLDPGETGTLDLFGGLNRSFMVKICRQSSGDCVELGPIADSAGNLAHAVGLSSIR
jgi:hypothetical protein